MILGQLRIRAQSTTYAALLVGLGRPPTIANFLPLNLVKGSVFMGQKLPKNIFWD